MTPEQRFTRIENLLNTVARHQAHDVERQRAHDENLTRIERNMDRLEGNMDRLEGGLQELRGTVAEWGVAMERSIHQHDLRFQKLTEFQTTLMESQNSAWRTMESFGRNLERLLRLHGLNGGPAQA